MMKKNEKNEMRKKKRMSRRRKDAKNEKIVRVKRSEEKCCDDHVRDRSWTDRTSYVTHNVVVER
jgi:hypothetical protein